MSYGRGTPVEVRGGVQGGNVGLLRGVRSVCLGADAVDCWELQEEVRALNPSPRTLNLNEKRIQRS